MSNSVVSSDATFAENQEPLHRLVFEQAVPRLRELDAPRADEAVEPTKATREYRQDRRWSCKGDFIPTGWCRAPNTINDKWYFRVAELSKRGMTLVTSLRNHKLAPGLRLKATFHFPTVSECTLHLEVLHVRRVRVDGKYELLVGVKFAKKHRKIRRIIASYLIQFSREASLRALFQDDLRPETISESVKYDHVRTRKDYQDVLALRLDAYCRAKKASDDDPEAMRSRFDRWENILLGKHQGRIVCSMLVIMPEADGLLEIEEDMDKRLDAYIEDRCKIAETTRFCTHVEYRGNDLIAGLFCEAAYKILEDQRERVFISADPELAKFYYKVGFRDTQNDFTMARYGDLKHKCLMGNVRDSVLGGKSVLPIYWSLVWKPLAEFIARTDPELMTFRQRLHLRLHRLLTPLARTLNVVLKRR